ncbi:fructose-1,6-bisphosphatase [Echria macrotheca]|uniref:Fructose-1,6-bisphosphatase n=1 Tax=Echria macrotheca TaxID=438768 RepID=A0AAJ0FBL2_9PEZI|nr:fructose-1,6-bisphosphatase [Echria macrotheca]
MGSIEPPTPLTTLLTSLVPSRPDLTTSILPSLLTALSTIASSLRTAQNVSPTSTTNTFGDAQLNVDILAESALRAALSQCPSAHTASSEEDPIERPIHDDAANHTTSNSETYTIAFDPLDGSSIIAPNWTVGTIIGIWDGPTALNAPPRENQVAAVLGVYGPRTTAIIAIRFHQSQEEGQVIELGLTDSGGWEIIRPLVHFLPSDSESETEPKYFAPANLRAASEDPRYMRLVTNYIEKRYTLRYSGGLVPDVVHALVKGQGVYLSPVTASSKAKLRRLYELCPLALVVECAGGRAVDPTDGRDVLDRPVGGCDERGGLVCGTPEEVEFAMGVLLGEK